MENTPFPFIIMTWPFLFNVTLTTYECVVKYLRILFLYSETQIHGNTYILFRLPKKKKLHSVHPNQHKVPHTVVYIQNRGIYCKKQKTKIKKPMLHPLLCFGLATAPHPHHMQCVPWPSIWGNIA